MPVPYVQSVGIAPCNLLGPIATGLWNRRMQRNKEKRVDKKKKKKKKKKKQGIKIKDQGYRYIPSR